MKIKVNTSSNNKPGILFEATLHPLGQFPMGAIFFIDPKFTKHFVFNFWAICKRMFSMETHNAILKTGVYLQNLS